METNQRYCLTLDLQDDPALIEEYKHWHKSEHIWPEIPDGIRSVGIQNMQIYLLGTRMFMIIESRPGFNYEKDMETNWAIAMGNANCRTARVGRIGASI